MKRVNVKPKTSDVRCEKLDVKHIFRLTSHFFLLTFIFFPSCMPSGKISTSSSTPTNYSSSTVSPSSSSSPINPHTSLLTLTILDVGQGDATLIQSPQGKTLLIDAGPENKGREVILPYLESQGITSLDLLIVSHFHLDHMGGVSELIAGKDGQLGTSDDYLPKTSYDRGGNPFEYLPNYPQYLASLGEKRQSLEAGEFIPLDPSIKIRCVVVSGSIFGSSNIDLNQENNTEEENSASIALLIEFGKFRYLTSGDLTGGGSPGGYSTLDLESELARIVGPVSALHVNHHGSSSSSNSSFVEGTQAQVAFFSLGDGNDYHHPSQEVLERWKNIGADLWLTEKGSGGFIAEEHVVNGNIVLETDGKTMKVNGVEYSL